MDLPIVSVIVPCYNQAEYIAECLDSVINQTYTNWECLVINDGSSDNSEELILPYTLSNLRIKLINQTNSGLSSARNTGLKEALGQFILPLDGDDKIEKTCIEKFVKTFAKNEHLKLVYSNVILFGSINGIWNLPTYSYAQLLKNNLIVATAMYKKDQIVNLGGYDPNMKSGYEDWDLWIRLLYKSPTDSVVKLQDNLFLYRRKKDSMIENLLSIKEKNYNTYRYITQKHLNIYSEYFESPLVLYHQLHAREFEYFHKPWKVWYEKLTGKRKSI